jgi:hypothetical protein
MARRTIPILGLVLIGLLLANCGATAEPEYIIEYAPAPTEAPMAREVTVVETVQVERAAPPAAAGASEESAAASGSELDDAQQLASLVSPRAQRMIIKNAELELLVANTDVVLDGITVIAIEYGGYIISTHTWYEHDFRYATVRLGVPVEEFENVLRRLRGMALRVLNEIASGEDVTDQYVDLQSRLTNLQATRDRIREFLEVADTVEEALHVNEQLSEVEGQIEEIQGRMNYLRDRAAYSTIDVQLNPELPTPTPSPTPTVTPTPTPRPTSTPEAWQPRETLDSATNVLTRLARGLADLAIWVVVVLGPFLVVLAILVGLALWWRRRRSSRTRTQPPAEADDS